MIDVAPGTTTNYSNDKQFLGSGCFDNGHHSIVASSVTLILLITISLGVSIEARAPPQKLVQISIAQAAKAGQAELQAQKAGGKINGTDFDRADILNGTSTVGLQQHGSTVYISQSTVVPTASDEGMIGATPTSRPTQSSMDEYIGPKESATPTPIPAPPPVPQTPILALSYAGSGGPKHCRGELLQKLEIPQPASNWINGTCVDVPGDAQCGVFFGAKDAACEAQLFNMPACLNTTMTYVNTVVFMPEERPIGARWRSMFVRCGVVAPEAGLIDPAILGGLIKPKPKPGGG
ncbi:hypothetical protein DM02DRAFT_731710 [Periconia macrospinosa]|uniref:Uncharacterized protein n=1 Tax=Periconia macrospinosa TaxID=97972 RepID=A0A2V1DCE4_9PLEO|nr:hypothetical protein DM02DRAFT_731710 [Periconia macrospinosa]